MVQPGLDNTLLVYVREPAVEGKANMAVRQQLSDFYGVSKTRVKIISGVTSKMKRYEIDQSD